MNTLSQDGSVPWACIVGIHDHILELALMHVFDLLRRVPPIHLRNKELSTGHALGPAPGTGVLPYCPAGRKGLSFESSMQLQ